MCEFKKGDRVLKRADDEHPALDQGTLYEITRIEYYGGDYFVYVDRLPDLALFAERFISTRPKFKGNN